MDQLGATQAERNHVRALILKKYGSQEAAARHVRLSKFTLSRVLNGREAEMDTLVKILRLSGHLNMKKAYKMPKEDLQTFYFLNGMIDADLLGNERERRKRVNR